MQLKNNIYTGANNRKSLFDLSMPENFNGKMILFLHGYKGFKDWGCWNLMHNFFVSKNYGFCKFNFSHNGGTIYEGIDFPDLEAFGRNTYSFELEDTRKMIDLICDKFPTEINELILIGHSRGGGIATLASKNDRINKLITLASISDIASRFPKGSALKYWKENNVYYVKNGRTMQEMPHYYSLYQDYLNNKQKLNITETAQHLKIPVLHIHGSDDTSVLPDASKQLAKLTKGKYFEINDTQHTFDAKHPWDKENLPLKMIEMLELICNWIENEGL